MFNTATQRITVTRSAQRPNRPQHVRARLDGQPLQVDFVELAIRNYHSLRLCYQETSYSLGYRRPFA